MADTDLVVHHHGTPGAPRVILLHGLTDAGSNWPDLFEHWGSQWDIWAVDLRGHGDSPRFTADQLLRAPEVMREDVARILDAQSAPVVLVGHSLGGLLALWGALDRPDAVRALVVEDPAQPAKGRTPNPEFVRPNEEFLDEMADPDRYAAKMKAMRQETPWTDAEIEAWGPAKLQVDRNYVREGLFFDDDEWESRFAALTMPTLVVIPPTTPMAPDMALVPNPLVEVAVIPESGHCVRRDQPARYFAAVDTFLTRVTRER
ncbi:alpha/beta fold hydrolase [Demequina sp.]|uniref:alpha/beta fold hydrolase n=1 Tax=Demequina sp. TaxID=2050685 RepID=UPI003D0FAA76